MRAPCALHAQGHEQGIAYGSLVRQWPFQAPAACTVALMRRRCLAGPLVWGGLECPFQETDLRGSPAAPVSRYHGCSHCRRYSRPAL